MPGSPGTVGRTIRELPRHTTVSRGGKQNDPHPVSLYEVPVTSPASFMAAPVAAVETKSATYAVGGAAAALDELDAEPRDWATARRMRPRQRTMVKIARTVVRQSMSPLLWL